MVYRRIKHKFMKNIFLVSMCQEFLISATLLSYTGTAKVLMLGPSQFQMACGGQGLVEVFTSSQVILLQSGFCKLCTLATMSHLLLMVKRF